MDALHRLVLGLALALAHIGGWNAIAPAPLCACAQAAVTCSCDDCVCKAQPTERPEAPERDEATVAPPTPRVPAPDRLGAQVWTADRTYSVAPAHDSADIASHAGTCPFAFWCVWRT